jgi:hypothetical protein
MSLAVSGFWNTSIALGSPLPSWSKRSEDFSDRPDVTRDCRFRRCEVECLVQRERELQAFNFVLEVIRYPRRKIGF